MEVVRRILDLTGASPDLVRHVADRPGHDRRYAVDSSKLRALGWTPAHSFDAGGLEETVEWYRENRDWWEPIKSGEYRALLRASSTPPASADGAFTAPRPAGMPQLAEEVAGERLRAARRGYAKRPAPASRTRSLGLLLP